MLPIDKLSVNVPGLTSEMGEELEERVRDFENIHEESASVGGAGYVPIIRKGDFMFAGIIKHRYRDLHGYSCADYVMGGMYV